VPSLAVSWDYRSLKNVKYAGIPLHTSGSIDFPDKITYDNTTGAYRFSFDSSASVEEILTEFWVLKSDLRKVFTQKF
jgi:hypothetical protein